MSLQQNIQNQNQKNIPWVEKYRPTKFENIVLDQINRKLFTNILEKKYFPNLLFYGPPGTGKTTTIINLINEYQSHCNINKNASIIHLNASDERGIDIIRNQINQFVKSKGLFDSEYKFVILDEVDYMTKNAQQALKYLLQTSIHNVRFCLICNYISKIDESLQNEFICIRFNQLPRKDIYNFIKNISNHENLNLSDNVINTIYTIYNSDIRSMINFIQLNQNVLDSTVHIINNSVWENLQKMLISEYTEDTTENIIKFIHQISIDYNMDKKNIFLSYFNFIIRNYPDKVNNKFFNLIENIIHNNDTRNEIIIKHFAITMNKHFTPILGFVSDMVQN